VDKILSTLAEYFLNTKKKVREVFREHITTHTIMDENFEVIPLKEFINTLSTVKIVLDTIDIYCIFTKLKYSDEYEAIDLNKLIEEMCNYGIFDENTLIKEAEVTPKPIAKEDLFGKIRNFIAEKNLTFDSLMFNILGKVSMEMVDGKLMRVVGLDDFESYIQTRGIIGNSERISDEEKVLILVPNTEKINLQKLKDLVENQEEEQQLQLHNVSSMKKNSISNDSINLAGIDEGDIEGL
jgi:hypothetical protein